MGASISRLHAVAGTIMRSGTLSNENFREVGSSCIAGRRGIEVVDDGAPVEEFMRFGDIVQMEVSMPGGAVPFGEIDEKVLKA